MPPGTEQKNVLPEGVNNYFDKKMDLSSVL